MHGDMNKKQPPHKPEQLPGPVQLRATLEAQRQALARLFAPIIETQKAQQAQLARLFQDAAARARGALLNQHIASGLKRVAEALRDAPIKMRAGLKTLGEHGWYLDLELTPRDLADLAASFDRGDVDAANETLVAHYRTRVADIAADLQRWYPSRAKVLARAFAAHERSEYELSVPIFLIQADGLCQSSLGVQLYARRPRARQPRTAHVVTLRQLPPDSLEAALLHPFELALPISASAAERRDLQVEVLNRYSILHGEATDYGTEMNSLKSISLLYYVASTLERRPSRST